MASQDGDYLENVLMILIGAKKNLKLNCVPWLNPGIATYESLSNQLVEPVEMPMKRQENTKRKKKKNKNTLLQEKSKKKTRQRKIMSIMSKRLCQFSHNKNKVTQARRDI